MTFEVAAEKLNALEAQLSAYSHAMGLLNCDGETAAPKNSAAGRGRTTGILSEAYYKLFVNDETKEILETVLAGNKEEQPILWRKAEVLKEEYDDMTRIPMAEYVAYQSLLSESNATWVEAKSKNDYALFAPYLEKIIEYKRKLAAYKNPDKPAYDVLLDSYEKGANMAMLDEFFSLLRKELTPIILEVMKRPAPDTSFLTKHYPIAQQRVFSEKLMDMLQINRDNCSITETEHPFTEGFNKHDVRITTHYKEGDVSSSMFSVIHEGGHAIYELNSGDEYEFTCLQGGASMGLHESQSRFYENLIGRSLPFCRILLPVMQEVFPEQMAGVTAEELYRAVNKGEPSLIRTEADELTYSMHVMIRYEMEKQMIAGTLSVQDLPAEWNRLYKEYLGIEVPNDAKGILQDIHWASGLMGYFPSYALGSAYGAQMLAAMEKEVDIWSAVEKGDLSPVTAWLKEKIHQHGRFLQPNVLLESACGGAFDPHYYVDYLKNKYTKLYNL